MKLLSALLLAHFMSSECKWYHSSLCMKVFILPRWFLQGLWQRRWRGGEGREWMWGGVGWGEWGWGRFPIPALIRQSADSLADGCLHSCLGTFSEIPLFLKLINLFILPAQHVKGFKPWETLWRHNMIQSPPLSPPETVNASHRCTSCMSVAPFRRRFRAHYCRCLVTSQQPAK